VLLAVLVGGGFLVAGWWQWRNYRYARELSLLAGAGLIGFEAAELAWIGFQPLEVLFAFVGLSSSASPGASGADGYGHGWARRRVPPGP
jgi:hypothetical protein